MWIIADLLDRWGMEAGFIVLISPIAYDIIGLAYGRDLNIRVETLGVIIQILGAVMMGLSKWIKQLTGGK